MEETIRKFGKAAVIGGLSVIAVLIVFFACCTVVDAGEVGVKFHKWSANEQDES